MIILIIAIVLILLILWLLPEFAETEDSYPYPQCKSCRYIYRNCTQDPCIICDAGSEWQKSSLDEQEEFDG